MLRIRQRHARVAVTAFERDPLVAVSACDFSESYKRRERWTESKTNHARFADVRGTLIFVGGDETRKQSFFYETRFDLYDFRIGNVYFGMFRDENVEPRRSRIRIVSSSMAFQYRHFSVRARFLPNRQTRLTRIKYFLGVKYAIYFFFFLRPVKTLRFLHIIIIPPKI